MLSSLTARNQPLRSNISRVASLSLLLMMLLSLSLLLSWVRRARARMHRAITSGASPLALAGTVGLCMLIVVVVVDAAGCWCIACCSGLARVSTTPLDTNSDSANK